MYELNKAILPRLLTKGDEIAIVKGCLIITPASGKKVPESWLTVNGSLLLIEIVNLLNIDAYSYTNYSTGRYGKNLYQGITLQFEDIKGGSEAHAILNAQITRTRSSKHGKAGDDLPNGQFKVSTKHNFYKFWLATGIKLPTRNSAFFDYMGKLKRMLFVGELNYKNKFINKTLRCLELSSEMIKAAYIQSLPNNIQATPKQLPNNFPTRISNKEMTSKLAANDAGLNSTTCESKYGLSYQGGEVKSNTLIVNIVKKRPQEQTNDEWMDEYNSA
tara:strand:- start:238 stop:1059 length:822 start_codon:yes stop_codon:yes gene_type:complete